MTIKPRFIEYKSQKNFVEDLVNILPDTFDIDNILFDFTDNNKTLVENIMV